MRYAIDKLNKIPFSARLIKNIHKQLLEGARGENKSPGSFRTGSVFIGSKGLGVECARYIPPEQQYIAEHFSALEKYINYDDKDFLVQLAIIHAQFEIIYPFWDGNSRTGRIIMPLFLYYKKVLRLPMFYLSEYFELHREEYYNSLSGISDNNDWVSWIKFFLKAVEEQSLKNIEKVQSVLDLYASLKDKIVKIPTPEYSIKVLDFLFSRAIFDINKKLILKGNQHLEL